MRGQAPAEPWYILKSSGELETTIRAYNQHFDIEEMFGDFKSGGDNLEGFRLSPERLDKLHLPVHNFARSLHALTGDHQEELSLQNTAISAPAYLALLRLLMPGKREL